MSSYADPPAERTYYGSSPDPVMHIPRGYWHRATRAEHRDASGYSLHATFGFPQRTGVDWLAWVADEARRQEVLRHDLHHQDTPGQQAVTETATQLIRHTPPEQFRTERETTQPPARHIRTHGLFGTPARVVCLTEYPPRVEEHPEDEAVVVRAGGRRVTLDSRARPALQALLSGHPVEVAALDATVEVDVGALVDVLLEHGLCGELHPELAAGYTNWVAPRAPAPAGAAPAAAPAQSAPDPFPRR